MAINLKKPLYVVFNGTKDVTFPMVRRIAKSWGKAMKLPIKQYCPRPLNFGVDQDQGY